MDEHNMCLRLLAERSYAGLNNTVKDNKSKIKAACLSEIFTVLRIYVSVDVFNGNTKVEVGILFKNSDA